MVLCAHADAGYLNKTKSRSRAGAHVYLSEDDPIPRFNGAVLTIATIIKFVMASAAEAELAALFIAARKMVPHHAKWYPTAKTSSTRDGHNHAAPYKPTIQWRLGLQTRPLPPRGPK